MYINNGFLNKLRLGRLGAIVILLTALIKNAGIFAVANRQPKKPSNTHRFALE